MSVVSPVVTVTVHAVPAPSLTLAVDRAEGWLGDVFTFSGTLMQNGTPVAGASIALFRNAAAVGSAVTDGAGNYSIPWTADIEGFLSFRTETPRPPLPPLRSPTVRIGVGLEIPSVAWMLAPLALGIVMTAYFGS